MFKIYKICTFKFLFKCSIAVENLLMAKVWAAKVWAAVNGPRDYPFTEEVEGFWEDERTSLSAFTRGYIPETKMNVSSATVDTVFLLA